MIAHGTMHDQSTVMNAPVKWRRAGEDTVHAPYFIWMIVGLYADICGIVLVIEECVFNPRFVCCKDMELVFTARITSRNAIRTE